MNIPQLSPDQLKRAQRGVLYFLAFFVGSIFLDRLGIHGKFSIPRGPDTWLEIYASLPRRITVSFFLGLLAYFWPTRRA